MRVLWGWLLLAAAALAQSQPASKDLRLVRPGLRQFEDGPALAATSNSGPGETLFFSFQVAGYKVSPEHEIELHWKIDVLDPNGVRIVETAEKDLKSKLSAEDKEWMPVVRHTFMIPPIVLPGVYRISATLRDVLGGREVSTKLRFTVRGREVRLADKLTSRNFRFLRAENEPAPLTQPVYHPGDTLWARFDIVGYQFGPGNRLHVSYGLAIAAPDGKTLFTQPDAATEQKESFYPQKYVPGVLSLTTQPNTRPGEYVLVLLLKDEVAGQTAEEKFPFRIE